MGRLSFTNDYYPYTTPDSNDCSMLDDYHIMACACNHNINVADYCRGEKKFSARSYTTIYYLYGIFLNNMYRSYEYYTHSICRPYGTPDGFLFCSNIASTETNYYDKFTKSTVYKVDHWPGTNHISTIPCYAPECLSKHDDWTCAEPNLSNEVGFNSNTYWGLFILFRYRQFTENVTLLPVNLAHWAVTFEQDRCVKIQTSAFHHYCFCMGTNKSEWLCRTSQRPQQTFGNLSKWIDKRGEATEFINL
ncbi:hypothetical protein DdX_14849 [Ditylenchus destructor]|uniref:Uncharacterized protein n=1 Tax=Ditylenchus destructor TaxID=166010 RepID=A0AAD4QY84_9BILA|nr:hypothetical protein DdX_14849 [Ditylenchus destructor]